MDLRTQTSLLAAVLSLAIAGSVLLRTRKRRVHWTFIGFSGAVAAWYLTTFLVRFVGVNPQFWERLNLLGAVLLPVAAGQFFQAFVADAKPAALQTRVSLGTGALLVLAVMIPVDVPTPSGPVPLFQHIVVGTAVFAYVTISLGSALYLLFGRSRAVHSRFERARLRYLALVGALAATFTVVDYLPYVGLDIPPVGTVLTLVFLYVLSQSILRYRLLDLYELAGRLTVLTALAFTLAAIFWVLTLLAAGRFFLFSVVAAMVVLLLFDPVRAKVEEQIAQIFFRERHDFEQTTIELRRRLAHVLELDDVTRVLIAGLEGSRRLTHVALYLADEELRGYDLAGFVGPAAQRRLELAPVRPLLDRLRRDGAVVRENLDRELSERLELGEAREGAATQEVLDLLDAMQASVCVALKGEREIYGMLCVKDERLRDAFSPEEVQLLRGLGAQAATAVENSRVYQRMKDRDRLAALGEMAAGLAHEIRNPLGAIKASAQYLADTDVGESATDPEFLGIIVDEVNRLNNIVSSFLDYARPSKGVPEPADVNATVRRTMQIVSPELDESEVQCVLALGADLPPVRIDVEQLRQVLLNLVQNARQAMENRPKRGGELRVETVLRETEDVQGAAKEWVEIRVTDTGPGIPPRVLQNLFVPFVTTKDKGTGLGLAISQRIVSAAHGRIEVRTHEGIGTTFVVRLPAADESSVTGSQRKLIEPRAAE